MEEFENQEIEKVLHIPCPSCGGKLEYSADKHKVVCTYCGNTEDVNEANDLVVELSLKEAVKQVGRIVPEKIGNKVINCGSCGSRYIVESSRPTVRCPFCASKKINLESFEHNIIQPSGIIPLKISRKDGIERFHKWIRKGIWHPRKLKRLANIENLHGIYVPFWTFDAQTESEWRGEAGYHYQETQRVHVNGKWETRTVTKTRWVSRRGHLSHFFDDVLVVASQGIQQKHIQKIFPYNLEEVINFDAKLMLGWEAEIYSIELDQGYRKADHIMDQQLYNLCAAELGGDTQRNLRVNTQKFNQTFKHIILPVWLCSYRYNDKVYQFLINGQTGRVGGKKPLSYIKIGFAILMVIAFFVLLWYLREQEVINF